MLDFLDDFQKKVLYVLIGLSLVILFVVAIVIFKNRKLLSGGNEIKGANCPDFWKDFSDGNGSNCVNNKHLGTCGVDNMDFSLSKWTGEQGVCHKYKWAKTCDLTWDGITNNPAFVKKCGNVKSIESESEPVSVPAPTPINITPQQRFYKKEWHKIPDPGRLKQVDLDDTIACGVNSGGQIFCSDTNTFDSPVWVNIPGGLTHVSVSNGKLYGVNAAGQIWYANNYKQPNWKNIAGGLSQVSIDGNTVCGVNSSGNIWCKDDLDNANWVQVPGSLKYVSINNSKLYGVNSNDDIWYADNYKKPNWVQIPGKLKQVELDGNTVCGVNSGDDIFCKDDLTSGNWYQIPGKLKHVTVNKGNLYGVNSGDEIFTQKY